MYFEIVQSSVYTSFGKKRNRAITVYVTLNWILLVRTYCTEACEVTSAERVITPTLSFVSFARHTLQQTQTFHVSFWLPDAICECSDGQCVTAMTDHYISRSRFCSRLFFFALTCIFNSVQFFYWSHKNQTKVTWLYAVISNKIWLRRD